MNLRALTGAQLTAWEAEFPPGTETGNLVSAEMEYREDVAGRFWSYDAYVQHVTGLLDDVPGTELFG